MARRVKISVIQPPFPTSEAEYEAALAVCRGLLEEAGQAGADIACLPELFNVAGLSEQQALLAAKESQGLVAELAAVASRHSMYVILPILEKHGEIYRNSSLVVGRSGKVIGRYLKVHCTAAERDWYRVVPGDAYPVFDLDFGKVGIMTCYDAYFPEVARILQLQGAEIIVYPGWQSGPSEIAFKIQMRARALDYCLYIARSSFGVKAHTAWKPGMFFGRSCIVAPDGTIIADAGHYVGGATVTVDLDHPRLMEVLDEASGQGSDVRDLRALTLADRRPETYGILCQPLFRSTEERPGAWDPSTSLS